MVAGAPATIAAAIEVPHGPIVEALLATGITVFAINPKQVDRFRDRYTVNGAKDDCRDAYVIAPSLSTDMQAFKKLTPEGPFTIRVRELSRTLDDLDRERRRPSNQLRELLFRYFPAMLQLSRPLMTPGCGRCLQSHPCRPKRSVSRYHALKRFLKHTGSGGLAPEVRIALQRECLDSTPHSAEAIAEHVGTLLPLLRAFHAQYKYVSSSLKNLLNDVLADPQREEHRTVKLLRPLPGVGIDASTTFLAEAAGLLAQADGRAFRCYAGIAPITKQSGKSKRVNMRYGAISACGRPAITGLERAFSAIQAADHITIGCGKWDTITGELCAASATV